MHSGHELIGWFSTRLQSISSDFFKSSTVSVMQLIVGFMCFGGCDFLLFSEDFCNWLQKPAARKTCHHFRVLWL